jgi:cellulose synthase/poly-beta-1,6-N-acetylglucosamine synthase-like glycosyltransferase
MEITLALKTLGYRCLSPRACAVTTEVMPTWRDLWRQRTRWQRGAVDNLTTYALTRTTVPYWAQQAGMCLAATALALYVVVTVAALAIGELGVQPFWLAIGGIFLVERVVTVRAAGPAGIALAAVLLFEIVYDLFQTAVYAKAAIDITLRRHTTWGHVAHPLNGA